MKISSILKQKRTWSIMLFYVLAVLIRVVSTRFETIDPSHVKLWDFVGGLSPLTHRRDCRYLGASKKNEDISFWYIGHQEHPHIGGAFCSVWHC